EVTDPDGQAVMGVAAPAQFDEAPIGALRSPPEAWQHTEEVLLELGLDWSDIAELRAEQVIP
ncbi:MAG: CoA transferase, partial [Ilumatobacteraceae bacterium]